MAFDMDEQQPVNHYWENIDTTLSYDMACIRCSYANTLIQPILGQTCMDINVIQNSSANLLNYKNDIMKRVATFLSHHKGTCDPFVQCWLD